MNRVSKVISAIAAAGYLFGAPAQAEPLEIGVLLPSPIADVGWSHACLLYTSPSPRDS